MFTVKAIHWHTGHGEAHAIGDVYHVETFEEVENLRVLRLAELIDEPVEPEADDPPVED